MIYQEGYVYHIKDEYFEKVQDFNFIPEAKKVVFPDIDRLEQIMLAEVKDNTAE